jgi:hypothetical protein
MSAIASLGVNIVVLTPVCLLLAFESSTTAYLFGKRTTAREILLCVYLTILFASIALLFSGAGWAYRPHIRTLLAAQVIYKVLLVFIIGDKAAPVLWSNLLIAGVHAVTLYTT